MKREKKEFKIRGISMQTTPETSVDGECCDMVNLRNKNGEWQVVATPLVIIPPDTNGKVVKYIHTNMAYKNLISYNGEALYWDAADKNKTITYVGQKIADISGISTIESIGNTLIAITPENCFYILFCGDRYKFLGNISMPELNFCLCKSRNLLMFPSSATLPAYIHEEQYSLEGNNITFITNCFSEMFSDAQAESREKRDFVYPFLVRYAVRLYDGSYIKPSPAVLMYPNQSMQINKNSSFTIHSLPDVGLTMLLNISVGFSCYKLCFDNGSLPSSDWDEIIDSIDIFISDPIMPLKDEKISIYNITPITSGDTDFYRNINISLPFLSDSELRDKIVDESLFYKISSISIKEIREKSKFPLKNLRDVNILFNMDTLMQQDRLNIENFSHFELGASTSYVYNSRIHLGDIKQFSPKPFSIFIFGISQDTLNGATNPDKISQEYRCYIKVKLRCSDGEKYVSGFCNTSSETIVSPFVSYPDKRATEMEIFLISSDSTYKYLKIPLKSSATENSSYYVDQNLLPLKFEQKSGDIVTDTVQNSEYYPNRIKVSEVDNPFFFPQRQTYQVSSGKILKLAAATAEMSQGQYGQFPLYIFTTDGIWTLEQGNEEILYSAQHPVSRDVALSSNAISSIEAGVAYISEHGLSILQGAKTKTLSNAFDGKSDIFDTATISNGNYDVTSSVDIAGVFKKYITESEIGYDYINKELLFLKSGETYFYAFALDGSGWVRREYRKQSFVNFVISYPELWLADNKGGLYNLSVEDKNVTTPFLIITRGIKGMPFCSKQLKEIFARIDTDKISTKITITVLASDNAAKGFSNIAAVTVLPSVSDYVRIPLYTRPYKYFRLTITGNAVPELAIKNLILTFSPKYTSRLK